MRFKFWWYSPNPTIIGFLLKCWGNYYLEDKKQIVVTRFVVFVLPNNFMGRICMYLIEWYNTFHHNDRKYYDRKYYYTTCFDDRKTVGRWVNDKKKGFKYETREECAKDIRAFNFQDCKVISIELEIGEVLANEIKKNLQENIKTAKKELTKDEYTVFLDNLVIGLAEVAEECTKFLDNEINEGTTVLPIIVPPKTVGKVAKKAPVKRRRATKKKVAKKRFTKR